VQPDLKMRRGLVHALSPKKVQAVLLLCSCVMFLMYNKGEILTSRVGSSGAVDTAAALLFKRSHGNGGADIRAIDTGYVVFETSALTGGIGTPPRTPMHGSMCEKKQGMGIVLSNHGWGVDIGHLLGVTRSAWAKGEPIHIRVAQLVHPGGQPVAPEGVVPWWHYSVGYLKVKADHYAKSGSGPRPAKPGEPAYMYTAPPVCANKDLSCFFKPIPCTPPDGFAAFRSAMDVLPGGLKGWLALFETRQRLLVPHKWLQLEVDRRVALVPVVSGQCAVLHVRRSDTSLNHGWGNMANQSAPSQFRFIPVAEYLETGGEKAQSLNITTIFTITDDASAIDELNALNESQTSGRAIVYLKRKRFRGAEGGWENHFPSGSALEEVLTILTIEAIVKRCILWIGTKSSFSKFLTAGNNPPIQYVWLSTKP